MTHPQAAGAKVAILATHGFEQSELEIPRSRLKEAGADVHVISPERGHIRGWHVKDWGHPISVDRPLDETRADDYDLLVLPGGQINPDLLRVNQKALDLVRAFHQQKKTIAAVCHAPWLLIETGLVDGHRATSYASIKTDMINAGVKWIDAEVVVDRGIITARNPGDLEAFSRKIVEALAQTRRGRSAA